MWAVKVLSTPDLTLCSRFHIKTERNYRQGKSKDQQIQNRWFPAEKGPSLEHKTETRPLIRHSLWYLSPSFQMLFTLFMVSNINNRAWPNLTISSPIKHLVFQVLKQLSCYQAPIRGGDLLLSVALCIFRISFLNNSKLSTWKSAWSRFTELWLLPVVALAVPDQMISQSW